MTYNSITTMPEVFITVNRGRRKIYNQKTVYLENGTHFEFELFNPTSQVLSAKIKINGNYISNRGILLNPGVRVFLERHIDTPEKFLFSTYMVNGNNKAVQKAIEQNGLIEVEFYPEKVTRPSITWSTTTSNSIPYMDNIYFNSVNGDNIGNISNTTKYCSQDSASNYLDDQFDLKFLDLDLERSNTLGRKLSKSSLETGRVEKGEQSNQYFTEVHKSFETFYMTKVEYKILPISEKPIQTNELVSYCTSCGKKAKKEHRFCSNCGSKL